MSPTFSKGALVPALHSAMKPARPRRRSFKGPLPDHSCLDGVDAISPRHCPWSRLSPRPRPLASDALEEGMKGIKWSALPTFPASVTSFNSCLAEGCRDWADLVKVRNLH